MKLRAKSIIVVVLLVLLLGIFAFGSSALAVGNQVENNQQVQFQPPILMVNASFLNVRTGPGVQYSVLVTVVGGTELPVLGVARDLVWYQVSTIAGVGWVNVGFTLPRGNFSNVPRVEAPVVSGVQPSGLTAPTNSSDAVQTVGFSTGREWGISVTVSHPYRSRPTINSSSLGSIGGDTSVIYTLLEAASGDGVIWYRINTPNFGVGWVEASKTQFRPFACELSAVIFSTSLAPGVGPNGSGSLDGDVRFPVGTEAYLLDAIGSFYWVETHDGSNGWVPSEAVTIREGVRSEYCDNGGGGFVGTTATTGTTTTTTTTQPQLQGPRVMVNTGFLNLRSGPGSQYSIVTSVPGGTELRVIGFAPDGVWYLVEGSFGQAWLNSEFTLFRGNGAGVPIIRDYVAAVLSTPTAVITNAVTMFASPNGVAIGAVSGPTSATVVARTADFVWIQISTQLGFGWVRATNVTLQGDANLIPVIGG